MSQSKKSVAKADDVDAINATIESFLAAKIKQSATISRDYETLWKEIARLMGSGGKRLRPRLTVLAYQLFGGKDVSSIIPIAAAQEFLHLGMLIHDDVIDRDYVRYGVDNIAGGYYKIYNDLVKDPVDRLHFSHAAAVLAGDLLISESYQLMATAKIPPQQILNVQKLLGTAIYEVVGGELIDTEATFRAAHEVDTKNIARYKTASYTTLLPMLVSAELATVPHGDLEYVREFGTNLGIAFQLRDDILGIFGDEQITGKTVIGDIREGKYTYMIEHFYQLASDEQRHEFDAVFGHADITPVQAGMVRELLKTTGALDATEDAIVDFESKARTALKHVHVDAVYYEQLDGLIRALTTRVK